MKNTIAKSAPFSIISAPDIKDLADVNYWIFDIDDTLYPKSSGLDKLIQDSITRHICLYLGIGEDEAREL